MIRSVVSARPATGPSFETSASKAPGQSSSVPSSRPTSGWRSSDKAGQMMRDLRAPRRPVVRHVVPPKVELVPEALLPEQGREPFRRLERARRVLPLALAADEQQRDAGAEPLEMVAQQVLDVVDRVVEVRGVAALAPADDGDVVDAAHADRKWEQVGAFEREVRGVVGAEAGSGDDDLAAVRVLVDEGRDDFVDPALVV